MRQDAFLNISFEPQLIKSQQIWSIDSYNKGNIFHELFDQFGGLGLSFTSFSI